MASPDSCGLALSTRVIQQMGRRAFTTLTSMDEVLQWELVAAVETISDRHMLPVLLVILERFPFCDS
jgi:hypothetical protein